MVGSFGDAFHFNGGNWYQYTELPEVFYPAVWNNEKYVFIVGNIYPSTHKTIVLRGKQKN